MFLALNLALNSSIVNFANLLRIKSSPFLIIEGLVKSFYVLNVDKVDKGVSNIAIIEEIDR